MKPIVSMRRALEDPRLLGDVLAGDSWAAWRTLLIAIMGEALTTSERVTFTALTGRDLEPGRPVEEFWAVVGRRGGKTPRDGGPRRLHCRFMRTLTFPRRARHRPAPRRHEEQAGVAFSYLAAIFAKPPFDKLKIREIAEQHLLVQWDRRFDDARPLSLDPGHHGHRRPRR